MDRVIVKCLIALTTIDEVMQTNSGICGEEKQTRASAPKIL